MDTDQEIFNAAMSDAAPVAEEPAAVAAEQTAAPEPVAEAKTDDRPRDEQGRFAPKAEEPAAQPAAADTRAPQPDGSWVPPYRMHEVTQERNEARQRLADAERERAEMRAWIQQQQRAAQRPAEPTKEPDWYDDPNAAARHAVTPELSRIEQALMYNSRLTANSVHTREKVDAAEAAFMQAVQTGAIDQADYYKVVNSPNRYDAAAQWHTRHTALSAIGGDLDAYNAKQKEAWLNDPATLALAAERIRAQSNGNGQGNGARPPVVQLPPSLNRATSAAGLKLDDVGDMSDSSLFKHAMAP